MYVGHQHVPFQNFIFSLNYDQKLLTTLGKQKQVHLFERLKLTLTCNGICILLSKLIFHYQNLLKFANFC